MYRNEWLLFSMIFFYFQVKITIIIRGSFWVGEKVCTDPCQSAINGIPLKFVESSTPRVLLSPNLFSDLNHPPAIDKDC